MGKLKWYKRDPDAALAGMFELTLEERGAYNTVLDLIYARSNSLPDDDRWIAGWLRCDVRVWRRLKAVLFGKGKLRSEGGLIRNGRADVEVDEALSRAVSIQYRNVTKGIKSGVVRRKNKELSEPRHEPTTNTTTTTTRKIESPPTSTPSESSTPSPVSLSAICDFEEFWEAYPRKVGKGQARRAWQAAAKKATPETILRCLERHKPSLDASEPKFIPHPSTWLNGERWLDEIPEPPKSQQPLSDEEAAAIDKRWAARIENDEAVPDSIIRNLIRKGMVSPEQIKRRGY